MARIATFLTTAGLASGALAHSGHLAPAGGHDHWELLAGIGVLALAVGVVVWARRRA